MRATSTLPVQAVPDGGAADETDAGRSPARTETSADATAVVVANADDPNAPLLTLEGDISKLRRRGGCGAVQDYMLGPHVSLYWTEKALLVLQYAQIWGLFWAFARPWPFPFRLRNQTRFTVWFNLDIASAFTFVEDDTVVPALRGSTYGVYPSYWAISIAWAVLPGLIALGYWLLMRYAWLRYWDMRAIRIWAQDAVLVTAIVLYLPAILALSRTYVCESHPLYTGWRLAVDPELPCFEYAHFILALACLPSLVLIWLGVPLYMIYVIHQQLVYPRKFEHERYVRWKEAEYVHGLSFDWRRGHFWLFSSFRRTMLHAYDRPLWMLSMSILVLVYCYSRRNPAIMADTLFGMMLIWQLRQVVFPGYRCGTSNVLASTIYTGMTVVVFWGVMRAHGMNNEFTVDSAFTLAQRGMNGGLLAAILLVFAFSFWPSFGWPRGYVGPALWQKLLAEEQAEEERERGLEGIDVPEDKIRARLAQRRAARRTDPWSVFVAFCQAQWQRCCTRQTPVASAHELQTVARAAAARRASFVETTQTPRKDTPPNDDALPERRDSPVPTARTIPAAWPTPAQPVDRSSTRGFGGGTPSDTSQAGDGRARTLRNPQMSSNRDVSGASGAEALDSLAAARRASAPDIGTADFDALLKEREREYELREYYGDEMADSVLSKKHKQEFAWDGGAHTDVEQGFGSARAARVGERQASARVTFAPSSAPFTSVSMPSSPARASGVSGSLSARNVGSRYRRHVVGNATETLQVLRQAESAEDASSVDSSAQARALTPAEISALEAVWVVTIKTARTALRANSFIPAEIVNVPLLRRWCQVLRRELLRAHRCRHVLSWSIEETLDDMSALADACQSRTLFPNPVLEALLHDFKIRLDRREREFALTSTKRRYLVTKLFTLAAFIGGRHIARLHIRGVNDKYFIRPLGATGETASTESEDVPDSLAAYAHIQSIFRDALPLEITMMGCKDLKELVTDVLSQRLVVDVLQCARKLDWRLSGTAVTSVRSWRAGTLGRSVGASGGTGAAISGQEDIMQADVSLLSDESYDFPDGGLTEDTQEMLVAAYDRIAELLAMEMATGESLSARLGTDGEYLPTPRDLIVVIRPWMARFAPSEAHARGLPEWTPDTDWTADIDALARPGSSDDSENAGRPRTSIDTGRSGASSSSRLSSRALEVTHSMLLPQDRRLVGTAMSNMRPDTSMSTASAVRPFSASMLPSRMGGASVADRHRADSEDGMNYSFPDVLSPIREAPAGREHSEASLVAAARRAGSSRGFGASAARLAARQEDMESDEPVERWDGEDESLDVGAIPPARPPTYSGGSTSSARSGRSRNTGYGRDSRLRPVFERHASGDSEASAQD